jgi:hypothetical protein
MKYKTTYKIITNVPVTLINGNEATKKSFLLMTIHNNELNRKIVETYLTINLLFFFFKILK